MLYLDRYRYKMIQKYAYKIPTVIKIGTTDRTVEDS